MRTEVEFLPRRLDVFQVLAIGLNPVDWKGADYGFSQPSYPWVNGRDFAGIVVKGPKRPSRIHTGDVVFGPSTDYRDVRKAACFGCETQRRLSLKGEPIPVVYASTINKVIKNHLSTYMLFVQDSNLVDENATVSQVDKERSYFLKKFYDCFSTDLLSELPPESPKDHGIDILPGNSPPNKPPYQVSAT